MQYMAIYTHFNILVRAFPANKFWHCKNSVTVDDRREMLTTEHYRALNNIIGTIE